MLRTLKTTEAPAARAPKPVCQSACMSLQWTTRQPSSRTRRNIRRLFLTSAATPGERIGQTSTRAPASRQRRLKGDSDCVSTSGRTPRSRSKTCVMLSTPPFARAPLCVTTKATAGRSPAASPASRPSSTFTPVSVAILPSVSALRRRLFGHALRRGLRRDDQIAAGHVRVAAVRVRAGRAARVGARERAPDAPPRELRGLPREALLLQEPVVKEGRERSAVGRRLGQTLDLPLAQK